MPFTERWLQSPSGRLRAMPAVAGSARAWAASSRTRAGGAAWLPRTEPTLCTRFGGDPVRPLRGRPPPPLWDPACRASQQAILPSRSSGAAYSSTTAWGASALAMTTSFNDARRSTPLPARTRRSCLRAAPRHTLAPGTRTCDVDSLPSATSANGSATASARPGKPGAATKIRDPARRDDLPSTSAARNPPHAPGLLGPPREPRSEHAHRPQAGSNSGPPVWRVLLDAQLGDFT